MWRSLVVPLAMIVAVAGGGATAARDVSARLTIEASTGSVTSVLVPSAATLECDGDARGSGFLQHAAKPACAVVRRGTVTKIANRHRTPRLCTEVYGGPQRARIRGTIRGRHIDVTIKRSDGCGIDEWRRLQAVLGDPTRTGAIRRRHRSPPATTTTAPAPYRVRRGDTLTGIAKQFHTSVAAIVAANHLADADHLTEGEDLVMPPPSAVRIDAKLVGGRTDQGFDLTLVGAEPSELVTFVITLPDGSTYTGSPHSASVYGVVTTTYTANIGSGTYTVTATGERGTNAATSVHVDPPD